MGQTIKNTFCSLPNVHVFIQPQGVKPCCAYSQISDLGIQDFWNSNELAAISESSPGCAGCQRREQTVAQSTRLEANAEWSAWHKQPTPVYLDLRISNLCNYSCRSCDPDFSSVIDNEIKNNPELTKFYTSSNQKIQYVSQENLDYVLDILPNLKLLRLAGGEPTHQPEVKKIIQRVIDYNLTQINIQITTNGSFDDTYWLEVIQKLPNIHWTLSLDGVEDIAELVRRGTKWNRVLGNLHFLGKHASSLLINTTVSNLNILHLSPLIKLVNSVRQENIKQGNGCDHIFQPVYMPSFMVPWNLTSELQTEAQAKCSEYQQLSPENSDLWQRIHTKLVTPDPKLWAQHLEFNNTLDRVRGEDHLHTIFHKYS